MRSHWRKLAVALALCGSAASAQDVMPASGFRRPCPPPANCPAPLPLVAPDGKPLVVPDGAVVPPGAAAPDAAPSTDAFADAGGRGAALAQGSVPMAPAFFGNLLGTSSGRFVLGGITAPNGTVVRVPSAAHSGGWAIVDEESPRPQDRIYYNFNYYSDVDRTANGGAGAPAFSVFRHIIGLEKTFLHDRASVGLRLL